MNKKIDLTAIKWKLFGVRLKLKSALGDLWDDLPESEDGFESVRRDFIALGVKVYDEHVFPAIEAYTSGNINSDNLEPEPEPEPEPTPTPEPTNNEVKIMNTGAKMSWNSYYYDKFVFPKCGPEYTSKSFTIEYSDGNVLHVPNPGHMTMTPDNMKYQPGGRWSGNNPDIPTMEVYARKDTHPEWVKAIFRHGV